MADIVTGQRLVESWDSSATCSSPLATLPGTAGSGGRHVVSSKRDRRLQLLGSGDRRSLQLVPSTVEGDNLTQVSQ